MSARSGADRRVTAEERRTRLGAVEDASVVMAAAANFLSVRPRSVAETRTRLLHLGYPPRLIEETLDRLEELAYLDDTLFARTWVESRDRAHPRGQIRLRRELALKGISRDIVDHVMEQRGDSALDVGTVAGLEDEARPVASIDRTAAEQAAAISLLKRRAAALAREPDPRRRRQKAYGLLARNGFDPDVCRQAAVAFSAEESNGTEEAEVQA
jgi:SOS response regulatory protein OraA/RecX